MLSKLIGLEARIISQDGDNVCNKGPCISSPCLNSGTCKPVSNETDSFQCTCLPGYTGHLCEENVDECSYPGKFIIMHYNSILVLS